MNPLRLVKESCNYRLILPTHDAKLRPRVFDPSINKNYTLTPFECYSLVYKIQIIDRSTS